MNDEHMFFATTLFEIIFLILLGLIHIKILKYIQNISFIYVTYISVQIDESFCII